MNLANESSNVTNTTSSSSLLRSKATTELGLRYALSMLTVLPSSWSTPLCRSTS